MLALKTWHLYVNLDLFFLLGRGKSARGSIFSSIGSVTEAMKEKLTMQKEVEEKKTEKHGGGEGGEKVADHEEEEHGCPGGVGS